MGTTLVPNCNFSWRHHPHNLLLQGSEISRIRPVSCYRGETETQSVAVNRRCVLLSGVSSTLLGFTGESLAVVKQGLLAGRVPGLSEPDEQG